MESIEEQVGEFISKRKITPYKTIYNSDIDEAWYLEVLIQMFAEEYFKQAVNSKLEELKYTYENRLFAAYLTGQQSEVDKREGRAPRRFKDWFNDNESETINSLKIK